jgi:hypothetical protein
LYSPRWLFLYPGLLLMVLGAFTGGWLLVGPRVVDGITFDVHTLLYAALAIIVGYQTVTFAVFTKVFGITEGLLPEDPRLTRLFRHVTLETGLIVGVLFFAGGFGLSVYALTSWSEHAFGPLDPSRTLRLVIPAAALIVLGLQTILSSFFLSILGLKRH